MIKLKQFVFIIFCSVILVASCKKDEELAVRGKLLTAISVSEFTPEQINSMLALANIQGVTGLKYPVSMVTITYSTIDVNGKEVKASAAIFLPKTPGSYPLFSFQHGTQAKNTEVASVKGFAVTEGMGGMVSASYGFIACVPDYLGLGASGGLHPYLIASVSASSVIDCMRATREYCKNMISGITVNNSVFLAGYSEGGYVTLATQKEIEENLTSEFNLTACAPMAGPYDLTGTVDSIFKTGIYTIPANAAYLAFSYITYYNIAKVDETFKSPYNTKIPTLFNGNKTVSEINPELTNDMTSLFTDDFMNNQIKNKSSQFNTQLKNNTLLNWTPKTKIRFYHGDADEVVPFQNTLTAYNTFKTNGMNNVEKITIPKGTHLSSAVPSVLGAIQWFLSLQTAR